MKNTLLLSALLIASLSSRANAQLPIAVDMDVATFAYSDTESILDIYMSFGAETLSYYTDSTGFRSDLPLSFSVKPSSVGQLDVESVDPIWADAINLSFALSDTAGIEQGQHFIHQLRTVVPPGEYELSINIPEDLVKGRRSIEIRRDLIVNNFSDEGARLSEMTLATSIRSSKDRENLFYRNGLIIQPNPNLLYGEALPQLFFYAEAYNLLPTDDETKYTSLSFITKASSSVAERGMTQRTERDRRSPDVLIGSFNTEGLVSGSYNLHLALLDEDNESVAEQVKKFFVYNPSIQRQEVVTNELEDYEAQQYAAMTVEELEDAFKHIEEIATDSERKQIGKLKDDDFRRTYLMNFWKKRDPDTSTPVNEYKEEFYSRLQYAKERYANKFNDGWNTDRGRVILKYGIPTAVEPHHFDRNTAAHEIWEYNNIQGQGQSMFIFADVGGFNEFELLHSTVTGERQSPNWRAELQGSR